MECIIDPYNDDLIYSSSQYGGMKVSYNGGVDWSNIKPVSYEGGRVTPYKMHPLDNNVLVADIMWFIKATQLQLGILFPRHMDN